MSAGAGTDALHGPSDGTAGGDSVADGSILAAKDGDVLTTVMDIAVAASVARLLHLACSLSASLPTLSAAVINDDLELRTGDEIVDDVFSDSASNDGPAGNEDLYTSRWFRHPAAIVAQYYQLRDADVARDMPTITVDGAPFDPVAHTVPSGYGDLATCSTKYDPEVRLCRELAARDGTVSP